MVKATIACEGKGLSTIVFEGIVFSGKGEGKKFISMPWVKQQIEAHLGFTPFFGTLNLHLNEQNTAKRKKMESVERIMIEPKEGFCKGLLFNAKIKGIKCAVVIPRTQNYPQDLLEVIASVCLREKLGAIDGSTVKVTVNV